MNEHVLAIINEVLEGERGSVLALVQLSAMATDALERHALVVTGGQAAQACIDLRAVLERSSAPVTHRVGDVAATIQELDRLDDRYRAFGQVQCGLMERIESIPSVDLDTAAQAALAMVHTVEAAHAAWALQRAHDFAASREAALIGAGRHTESGDGQQVGWESRPTSGLPESTGYDEPSNANASGGADVRLPTIGAEVVHTRPPQVEALPWSSQPLDDSSPAAPTDRVRGTS